MSWPSPLRGHLGSGRVYLKGWVNVELDRPGVFLATEEWGKRLVDVWGVSDDRDGYYSRQQVSPALLAKGPLPESEIVCDVKADVLRGLPFGCNTVDEILCRQLIEHFDRPNLRKFFEQMDYSIKPGGILRVDWPDYEGALRRLVAEKDETWRAFLMRHVLGPRSGEHGCHFGYTRKEILDLARDHGFEWVEDEPPLKDRLYPAHCLRFRKPLVSETDPVPWQRLFGVDEIRPEWNVLEIGPGSRAFFPRANAVLDIVDRGADDLPDKARFVRGDICERTPFADREFDFVFCCAPDTLVTTENGPRQIEALRVGDTVLTHRGRWRKVTRTMRRRHSGYLVSTLGAFGRLRLTAEHEILVREARHPSSSVKHYKYADERKWIAIGLVPLASKFFSPSPERVQVAEWMEMTGLSPASPNAELAERVRAMKLAGSTYDEILSVLGVPRKTANQWVLRTRIPRGSYEDQGNKVRYANSKRPLPKVVKVDGRLARLLGYFASDGCVHRGPMRRGGQCNQVSFYFGIGERKYADDVCALMRSVFMAEPRISQRGRMWCVRLCSRDLAVWFKAHCRSGLRRGEKILPPEITEGPDQVLRQAIIGLWRGDGSIGSHTASYVTVSRDLAWQVQVMLSRLGMPSRVSWTRGCVAGPVRASERGVWTVHVSGDGHRRLSKMLGHPRTDEVRLTSRLRATEDGVELGCRGISLQRYDGWVYNLSVEEDESYVANGVAVHNCSHVLEHVKDPAAAAAEISRIGKRGLVECPHPFKEVLFAFQLDMEHRWWVWPPRKGDDALRFWPIDEERVRHLRSTDVSGLMHRALRLGPLFAGSDGKLLRDWYVKGHEHWNTIHRWEGELRVEVCG